MKRKRKPIVPKRIIGAPIPVTMCPPGIAQDAIFQTGGLITTRAIVANRMGSTLGIGPLISNKANPRKSKKENNHEKHDLNHA